MKRDFCNRYEKLPFKAILLSLLIIFVCASAFCGCVSAGVVHVNDFENLNKSLSEGNDVIVDSDITTGFTKSINITNSNTLSLDLNGYKITCNVEKAFNITDGTTLTVKNSDTSKIGEITSDKSIFYVNGSHLIIDSNCKINATGQGYSGIKLYGGAKGTPAGYSSVCIEKGAEINASYPLWIHSYDQKENSASDGAKIIVNGTLNSSNIALTINGFVDNYGSVPAEIIINEGAILKSSGVAIYGAGYGIWTINGGTFTAEDGEALSIKSGKFIINGGTFISNGEFVSPTVEHCGYTAKTGAALGITDSPSGYPKNVEVVINNGKFTSTHGYAVYECDVLDKEGDEGQLTGNSALGDNGIIINGGEFTKGDSVSYPIYIKNLANKQVKVTINGQTPFYPGLNTSSAYWVNDTETGNWEVTLNGNIENVMSIDLRHVPTGNIVTLKKDGYNFVKVVKDDKYSFDGWSNSSSTLGPDTKVFYGGVEYKPNFTYIKQYDTGEEVEDDEPTPTAEPTPIVTPTQNQTVKPTIKPTPEPKTVVIVETEVKFEDNKVITSITVPEGSSGSITFTQTEEKGMDEWIPESIEDSYSFDLSCDGEINGDSEIHFVMSDAILKSLGLTPEDVCLKHFEDGVWVKLKISYIILDDGTYYYTAVTKSFSPFEISFDAKSEEPTVTPTEPTQPKSPMPLLGLLAGLGAAALLIRRK